MPLPKDVEILDFGEGLVLQTWHGYAGEFFDAEGHPTDEWTERPRVKAEVRGYPPSEFGWFTRAYAKALGVDAERLTVRQTHAFAGDILIDGQPLVVSLATEHAFHEIFMAEACAPHGILRCEHCATRAPIGGKGTTLAALNLYAKKLFDQYVADGLIAPLPGIELSDVKCVGNRIEAVLHVPGALLEPIDEVK